jgi:hypothetical protein
MPRVFAFALVAFVAFAVEACSAAPKAPAKPPPVDAETRLGPARRPVEPPRILAPPPAYGNKIVLGSTTTRPLL